jgi:hypothetical protein
MHRAALAVLALLSLTLAPALPAASAEGPRKLTGSYRWEQANHSGTLEAEFKPAGELHWEVAFHFTFNGSPITYTGTADGHLDEGTLQGKVESTGIQRFYVFRGEVKGGKFTGTHAELTDKGELRTGTLTMDANPVAVALRSAAGPDGAAAGAGR